MKGDSRMIPKTMKAVCFYNYGTPEELVIRDLPVPEPADNEILVKMCASSFSPADAKARNGWYRSMYELEFPRIPSIEIGGTVVAMGKDVTDFQIGDKVIAFKDKRLGGALAEYCAVDASEACLAPKGIDLAPVCAIPGYALSAMQVLTEESHLQSGQRIMFIGAAGGIGQLAMQIAKTMGAYVIGCDAAENEAEVRELGADEFVAAGSFDYEKFAAEKLDVIVSVIPMEEPQLEAYLKCMNPGGAFVSSVPLKNKVYSGPDYDGKRGLESLCLSKEMEEKYGVNCRWMTVKRGGDRLKKIVTLLEEGKLKPVIQQTITMQGYKQLNYDFEAGKVRGRHLVLIEGHI